MTVIIVIPSDDHSVPLLCVVVSSTQAACLSLVSTKQSDSICLSVCLSVWPSVHLSDNLLLVCTIVMVWERAVCTFTLSCISVARQWSGSALTRAV